MDQSQQSTLQTKVDMEVNCNTAIRGIKRGIEVNLNL